jgi:hypothetical protein
MPISYERDNHRRLITVTVTDPYTQHDVLTVIDRQAAEGTWEYAVLYNLQGVRDFARSADESASVAAHVAAVSGGRPRGPVGLWVPPQPAGFQTGMDYSRQTSGVVELEVLLTRSQVDAWLARSTKR